MLIAGFLGHSAGQRAKIISKVQRARKGKQIGDETKSGAGVDFSGCETDSVTGFCCVDNTVNLIRLQTQNAAFLALYIELLYC